jgi:hypothetical protein
MATPNDGDAWSAHDVRIGVIYPYRIGVLLSQLATAWPIGVRFVQVFGFGAFNTSQNRRKTWSLCSLEKGKAVAVHRWIDEQTTTVDIN